MGTHPLCAFLSSRMEELAVERKVVKAALATFHVDAWVFETDAGARPDTIEQTYLKEIEAADLYIGVFWTSMGSLTHRGALKIHPTSCSSAGAV